MIKVLIADDHPIVRQGLRQILTGIPDMAVAGEAVKAQETLDPESLDLDGVSKSFRPLPGGPAANQRLA